MAQKVYVKVGFQRIPQDVYSYKVSEKLATNWFSAYSIDANYNLFNHFDIGAYFAISPGIDWHNDVVSLGGGNSSWPTYFYGLNFTYHLLPLFTEKSIRFDVYAVGRVGLMSQRCIAL